MHAQYIESERLGRGITELSGDLYAATWRLLTLIREFDEQGGWELPGLVSCAHSAEALRDVPAGTSSGIDRSHLQRGPGVPAETSRRLACDGAIVPLLEDADGQPLSIGRKSRSIPPAIRRALRARDRGCRFPGCINRYHLDGHHIRHWADGGETSLDNLLHLCRHHHRLLHEGGFSRERQTGGRIVFRDRHGQQIDDGHVPETAIDTTDETAWFEDYLADVDIDAGTCVTRWEGERIDWPLAVGHLFQ